MAFELFRLAGNIVLNTSEALTGLSSVQNAATRTGDILNSVGGKVRNFGIGLTAGITAPLAGLITNGIKYNATVQELETSFKVLLGSEEKAIKLTKQLKKVGAETSFEVTGLAQASKTLLAFGVSEKKLIPTMTRLGDISLGNNEAFQAMSRVMGQINALGKLQGGDLNQLINWGWNPLNEITKKTGETMEQVRKRMSKGKVSFKEVEDAMISATSKGGRFFNGMKEGSKTLTGRISTLKDTFNEFLGEATKPLFTFISDKVVPGLTKLIEKFNKLDPTIKSIIPIATIIVMAFGPAVIVFGSIIGAIGSIITGIGSLVGVIGGLSAPVVAIIGIIGGIIVSFALWKAGTTDLKKSLISALNNIKTKISEFAKFVKKNIGNIKQAFLELPKGITTGRWELFGQAMRNMFPDIYDEKILPLIIGFEKFKSKVIAVKNAVLGFGKNALKFIMPIINSFKESIKKMDFTETKKSLQILGKTFQQMGKWILPIAKIVGVVLYSALGILVSMLNGVIRTIPYVIGAFSSMATTFYSVINLIVGIISGDGQLIIDSLVGIKDGFIGTWKNLGLWAYSWFSGFISGIVEWFTNLYDILVGNSIIPDMVNDIIDWFLKLPSRAAGIFSDLVSTATSYIGSLASSAWEWGSNLISGFISGLQSKVGEVTNFFSGIAQKAEDFIGWHSPTKKGAGKNSDKWAPNFMKMFISGLKKSLPGLTSTVSKIAETIRENFYNATTAVRGYFDKMRDSIRDSISNQKSEAVQRIDDMASIIEEALRRKNPFFETEMTPQKLLAEQKRLLDPKNKKELEALLKKYYPDWQNEGQTIGDIIINGLNSKKKSMSTALNEFFGAMGEAIKVNANSAIAYINNLEKTYTKAVAQMQKNVNRIESLKDKLEKAKDIDIKTRGKSKKDIEKQKAAKAALIKKYQNEIIDLEKSNKALAKKYNMTYKEGSFFFPDGTQAFAKGVTNFRGGWALVGERGPELLKLPRGSDVIANDRLHTVKNGPVINLFIDKIIDKPQIFDRRGVKIIANEIKTELQSYMNFRKG